MIQIGTEFEERRAEILNVRELHQYMWDIHLRLISGAEHKIDFIPYAAFYRSLLYCADIRMRDIEKAEVD